MDPLTLSLAAMFLASAATGGFLTWGLVSVRAWWARHDREAAKQYREDGRRFRAEAEVMALLWQDLDGASAHAAYGARVHDHCEHLKAERDKARQDAKEWESIAVAQDREIVDLRDKAERWGRASMEAQLGPGVSFEGDPEMCSWCHAFSNTFVAMRPDGRKACTACWMNRWDSGKL